MKKILLMNLLVLSTFWGFAQEMTVSGTVTDLTGEPLPGVNVVIKNSGKGTATDFDGNFKLAPSSDDVLVFSFIGFVTEEIRVGTQSVIDVTLQEDITSLQEVVVVGYGVQKKAVATSSVSKVEAQELQGFSIARADQALQGQVAGVTFKSASGQPGSAQNIFIRGVGTNGDPTPLTIVDGVAFPNNDILGTLNPNDIESIQVLKDGASTAIYGTRAANGVIIVTTKKGTSGAVTINYDVNYGVSNAWRTPEMLNSDQYIELITEKYGSQALPANFPNAATNTTNTNWMEEIFEPGSSQTHQLSISKGGENGSVYSSLSYFNQEGNIAPEKSNLERITARINSESIISDYVTFGQNLYFNHETTNRIPENSEFGTPTGDALVYDPTTPARDPNSLYGFAQSALVKKEYINPLSRIFISNTETISDALTGNFYFKAKPIEGLEITSDIGINYRIANNKTFSPSFQFEDTFGGGIPVSNELNDIAERTDKSSSWQWENYATYTRSFGKHTAQITVGTTALERYASGFGGSSSGINEDVQFDPNFQFITQTPDSLKRAYSYEAEKQAISSIFGRVIYDYDQKYLTTFILRRDGSTQFGENSQYGIFPSASVGWVVSREDFFPDFSINFVKLRASYGVNGNDRIGALNYVSTVEFSGDYQFGKPGSQVIYNGQSPLTADNPNIKWEESQHLDIGIELGLFNDQMTIELDYFNKTTSDLLMVDSSLPLKAGLNAPVANVGEVVNKGLELAVKYRKSIGDLNLNFGFNASTLNNEVTQVATDGAPITGYTWPIRNTVITQMEVGRPIGYFRGYKNSGVFSSQNEVFAHINSSGDLLQPNAVPGDLRFEDTNGDGRIDSEDITEIGKPWADLVMGLNIGANYKSFDFRILFSSSIGSDIFRSYERQDVLNNNYQSEWLDRWSESNPGGSYPRVTLADANNNTRPSDFYVESGDYLRIKNLQLGYSVPANVLEKIGASKVRVYASFDNILTLTGYTGFDPEIGSSGSILDTSIDKGFYPQAKTISVGANISF